MVTWHSSERSRRSQVGSGAKRCDVESGRSYNTFRPDGQLTHRPVLLRSEAYFADDDADPEPRPLPEHKDEQQVLLDTKRSFVTYPAGIPPEDKDEMQADLQDLIVGILRKYPTLNYFQVRWL